MKCTASFVAGLVAGLLVIFLLGAVFSAYTFMPKKRVLPYSLDPNQPGD